MYSWQQSVGLLRDSFGVSKSLRHPNRISDVEALQKILVDRLIDTIFLSTFDLLNEPQGYLFPRRHQSIKGFYILRDNFCIGLILFGLSTFIIVVLKDHIRQIQNPVMTQISH